MRMKKKNFSVPEKMFDKPATIKNVIMPKHGNKDKYNWIDLFAFLLYVWNTLDEPTKLELLEAV